MSDKTQGKTLYELWESNDLPVQIHVATEYIFNAYKHGTSGHEGPLKKAFPDYFVEPWNVFPKKSQPHKLMSDEVKERIENA